MHGNAIALPCQCKCIVRGAVLLGDSDGDRRPVARIDPREPGCFRTNVHESGRLIQEDALKSSALLNGAMVWCAFGSRFHQQPEPG